MLFMKDYWALKFSLSSINWEYGEHNYEYAKAH